MLNLSVFGLCGSCGSCRSYGLTVPRPVWLVWFDNFNNRCSNGFTLSVLSVDAYCLEQDLPILPRKGALTFRSRTSHHVEHARVVNYATHLPQQEPLESLLYVSMLQAKPQHLAATHSIWLPCEDTVRGSMIICRRSVMQ